VKSHDNENMEALVDRVVSTYPREPASLISVLQDIQEEHHYLPRGALERVAEQLGTARNQLYYVATFYKAFSLKPRGKHIINVCRGTACHVKGAEKLVDVLNAELNIKEGETTEDRLFTVQSIRCVGCCSLAPVVMIDKDVHGGVTPASLRKILKTYKSGRK